MQRGSPEVAEVKPDYAFWEQDHFDAPGYPKLHFIEHDYAAGLHQLVGAQPRLLGGDAAQRGLLRPPATRRRKCSSAVARRGRRAATAPSTRRRAAPTTPAARSRASPSIPRLRPGTRCAMIEAAMIWNEPNNKSHWDLEHDPGWRAFAEMAKLAGAAIASEAPGLPRVLGGMSPIDPDFLRVLQGQDVMAQLDAVAVHGFPLDWNHWLIDEWPEKLASIQRCTDLPVWVSEVGISTFGAEEVQEWGLKRTAELLIGRAPRIHWYSLYDLPAAWPATTRHREAEGSSYYRHFHMGLLDEHGRPKLAAKHFADYTPEIGLCQWFHYQDHRLDDAVRINARHGCHLPAHRTELGGFLPPRRAGLVRPANARAGRVRHDGDVLLHPRGPRGVGAPHVAAARAWGVCRVLCGDDPAVCAGAGDGGQGRKAFFFEKKQKTFCLRCRALAGQNRDSGRKSFLVLFFQKRTCLLAS